MNVTSCRTNKIRAAVLNIYEILEEFSLEEEFILIEFPHVSIYL